MIPSFPRGATLYSLYEASVRTGRFASMSSGLRAVIGLPPSANHLFLGYRARDFCRIVLDDAIDPTTLLQEHTLFPIFTCLYRSDLKEELRHNMISGNRTVNQTRLRTTDYVGYVSERPRFCQQCIIDDLRTHGHVYRRLAHQLANERHCDNHDLELWEGCRCKAEPFRWDGAFPICPICRTAPSPISSTSHRNNEHAFKVFNDILKRLLNDDAPEFQPRCRRIAIRLIAKELKTNPNSLIQKFLDWIQIINPADLSVIFRCGDPINFLKFSLEGRHTMNDRINLIARAFAWEQLPPHIKNRLTAN